MRNCAPALPEKALLLVHACFQKLTTRTRIYMNDVYVCMYTYIHTCIYTCIHTPIYTYAQLCTGSSWKGLKRLCAWCMRASKYWQYAYSYISITYIYVCMYTHIYTCIYIYKDHVPVHIYIMYIYIRMCMHIVCTRMYEWKYLAKLVSA